MVLAKSPLVGDKGAVAALHRSRKEILIMEGHCQAEFICCKCTECELKEKTCQWARCQTIESAHAQHFILLQRIFLGP
jgi:hypothetical protein